MKSFSTFEFQSAHDSLRRHPQSEEHEINDAVHRFTSHNLQQQDDASLMDRVDTKYLLPVPLMLDGFSRLDQDYTVLEIDSQRLFTYQNTYFDSENLNYYLLHHNGKLNRHKVRYRRYLETDTEFFEIKFKTNKSRTIKQRELLTVMESAVSISRNFAESIRKSWRNTTKESSVSQVVSAASSVAPS